MIENRFYKHKNGRDVAIQILTSYPENGRYYVSYWNVSNPRSYFIDTEEVTIKNEEDWVDVTDLIDIYRGE